MISGGANVRRLLTTLLAVVISVVAARGAAGQGQGRPHLKVLSDVPESQLFMVMNAVAGSLGVGCEHCHVRDAPKTKTVVGGWKFDRNDKPAKAKGLEMMRMTREINASRYGGRPVVTCFTCHHGELRVAGTPPLPPREGLGAAPAGPVLPSAQQVLAKYAAAVGGADAAVRFGITVLQARDERSEDRRGELTISFRGSDRYRVDLSMPPEPARSLAFAGSSGWVSVGGVPRLLTDADVVRLRRQALRYAPLKVPEPAEALRVERVEPVRGRDTYAVVTDVDPKTTRTYFFDVTSGLLARESTITATALVPLQEQVDYEDYRPVDGVLLPFLVRTSDDAPYATSTKTFTRITHGAPPDETLFAMPQPPATPAAK